MSLVSVNANDSKTAVEVGGNQKSKGCPILCPSFYVVFEVLITGVKGQYSSEVHTLLSSIYYRKLCAEEKKGWLEPKYVYIHLLQITTLHLQTLVTTLQ